MVDRGTLSRKRVVATMLLEEPDMVPLDEELWGLTFENILKLKDKNDENSYIRQLIRVRKEALDLDIVGTSDPDSGVMACLMPYGFRDDIVQETGGRIIFRDPNGIVWIHPSYGEETVLDHPIKTYDQLDSFEFATPDIVVRYNVYKERIEKLRDYFFIMGEVMTPFELAYRLRGHERLLKDFYLNPRFLRELFERCHRYIMDVVEILLEMQVDGIIFYGDIAYNKGPMISPKHHRELLLPLLRKEVSYCRNRGVLTRFHSDGNITPLIPQLIEAGFNAIDPLEQRAGMDLSFIKREFGDRLCLVGGVDIRLLINGSSEDVVEAVKRCISEAAPGGGYILHSSGSIGPDVPLENLFTMVKVARKYGRY